MNGTTGSQLVYWPDSELSQEHLDKLSENEYI